MKLKLPSAEALENKELLYLLIGDLVLEMLDYCTELRNKSAEEDKEKTIQKEEGEKDAEKEE